MGKLIIRDVHARLFFTNALLVLLGYLLATLTDEASLLPMKYVRLLFLLLAITRLLLVSKNNSVLEYPLVFVLFFSYSLLTVLFSGDIGYSFNRWLLFFIGVFYIQKFLSYAVRKYGFQRSLDLINYLFLITYLFPIMYFIVVVRNFDDSGFYGLTEGRQGFVSNHFGWSSAIVALLIFHKISLRKLFTLEATHLINWSIFILSSMLLLLSANRSGLLSFVLAIGISTVIRMLRDKRDLIVLSFSSMLVVSLGILYFSENQLEVFTFIKEKSITQIENNSEARFVVAGHVLKSFFLNPLQPLIGFGVFNYELNNRIGFHFSGYHNSYLEVLFGTGLIGFSLFYVLFLKRSISSLFSLKSNKFLVLFPIMIIPFFESNITIGQFLFYPWFTYMILFSTKKTFLQS